MTRLNVKANRTRTIKIPPRAELVDEAKRLNVDISEACERGLVEHVSNAWRKENRGAIEDCNRYVEENGLPLARYRLF
ncbi:MAG: type II toxin-antitoxin system CcdA family antitoxin [Sphingomonas sp.]|nr:type II toxin-antitoxin system CcdA family antitoxin [Sphingomonas sp.]